MSLRRLFALAFLLCAAGPASAEPLTVQIYTNVLRSDPGLFIPLPQGYQTFQADANGEFTFPVFRLTADDGPPPHSDDIPHGTVVDKVRSIQVEYTLIVPGMEWGMTFKVEGVTSYSYQFREPPQEGFGWRTVEQFEGLDFLDNPNDPSQLTSSGVTFRRRFDGGGQPGYSIEVTGLPQLESPEPCTLLLAGLGLGVVAVRRKKIWPQI